MATSTAKLFQYSLITILLFHCVLQAAPSSRNWMQNSPTKKAKDFKPRFRCPKTTCGGYVSCPKEALTKRVTQISSIKQLFEIKSGGNYELIKDINLPDISFPIGSAMEPIKNIILNGNGYSIRNLSSSLFSYLESSTIVDLHIEDVKVAQQMRGGVLVNKLGSYSCVERVSVVGGWIYGLMNTGGLVGTLVGPYSVISKAYTNVVVRSRGGRTSRFGGLVGLIDLAKPGPTLIAESHSEGKVLTPESNEVGGLIGTVKLRNSNSSLEIIKSYAKSEVSGRERVGGFIGSVERDSRLRKSGFLHISDSYADGLVEGKSWEDPKIAKYSSPSKDIGGFIGHLETGEIKNSYSKGLVLGRQNVGGFIGTTGKRGCEGNSPCKFDNSFAKTHVKVESLKRYPKNKKLSSLNVGKFSGAPLPRSLRGKLQVHPSPTKTAKVPVAKK